MKVMKIIRILLAPYRAWVKAFEKSMSEIEKMDEPERSWLKMDIFFLWIGRDQ